MIRVNNVHIPLDYDDAAVRKRICRELRVDNSAVKSVSIFRRSVDARKKDNIFFLCAVDVVLNINEDNVLKKAKNASKVQPYTYDVPKWKGGASPLVVGMGPAGLFAALILAQSGANPIVIERGKDVDSRTADVNKFWTDGTLNTSSNVQFGEGGAGTFSDGKLNTGTKDSRQRKVLLEFVGHGAPKEILYDAKPHIGTDKLKLTVKKLREEIIELGGRVMFETKLTGFHSADGKITAAVVESNGKTDIIETDSVILAIGHSARDTFEMLYEKKLPIEAKPFSVGARIEHLREEIDRSQYGRFAGNKALGAANYKMNVHTSNGRGAYTFAALLVGVSPEDYRSDSPLGGMYFQRELEEKAFALGGGGFSAPVQKVGDFINNKKSDNPGEVLPSIGPDFTLSDLNTILPEEISRSLKEAIISMGRKLKGFDSPDAVLTGLETRSSSPIRILRNVDTLESVGLKGLYPCGEGAGYAGGIISAAVDGIKCAEKVIEK